jgi:hypothetical protein
MHMLSLLLANLADPNISEDDLTAMHYACENLADLMYTGLVEDACLLHH